MPSEILSDRKVSRFQNNEICHGNHGRHFDEDMHEILPALQIYRRGCLKIDKKFDGHD
jgi:hypothetical protein